ncbi:MAG TPA: hypothetical protein VMI53_04920 [Opitutaceae bacterium]|nr:hypothetical protein [Opitutaceae bacterium]
MPAGEAKAETPAEGQTGPREEEIAETRPDSGIDLSSGFMASSFNYIPI